jgi:hypothetical protein
MERMPDLIGDFLDLSMRLHPRYLEDRPGSQQIRLILEDRRRTLPSPTEGQHDAGPTLTDGGPDS